jgi:7-cyano-7-deazaguanine synthase
MPTAVVMLSGGLDSATVAAIARAEGFEVAALSFDYGQRHRSELAAARRVAAALGIARHAVVRVDLSTIGGSALTDAGIAVPKQAVGDADLRALPGEVGRAPGSVPVTYVPARNTVFLSIALGMAEVVGAHVLYFGANALDYSGYPDCRPEFVRAFEALANVATRAAVEDHARFEVRAPLMTLTKAEIIRRGLALGVDYAITQSCYDPVTPPGGDDADARACGRCDACVLRRRGFAEAGVPDVTRYAIEGPR